MRPVLLDLFCGPGGAGAGYRAAGFEVVGVDIVPQPNYPFEFHQADALDVLTDRAFLARFDAAHASPNCQGWCAVTDWRGSRASHPDMLTPTLALLPETGLPWVVENVPEAAEQGPLRADYLLCGTQFGLAVRRHRVFQAGGWTPRYGLLPPCHCRASRRWLIAFDHSDERAFADAMGCTWMSAKEGRQAVPPAYTQHIGRQLLAALTSTAMEASA